MEWNRIDDLFFFFFVLGKELKKNAGRHHAFELRRKAYIDMVEPTEITYTNHTYICIYIHTHACTHRIVYFYGHPSFTNIKSSSSKSWDT